MLKSPTLLLVMAGNVPAPMAVYITYTYLPTVGKHTNTDTNTNKQTPTYPPTVGKQKIWQTSVSGSQPQEI